MTHRNIKPSALYLIPAALLLSSCTYMSQGFLSGDDRGGKSTPNDRFGDSAKQIIYLDQNWDASDSLWFYNTTQGSDLLPWDIFLNLELADSEALLRSDENMNSYRYLTQHSSWDNPEGLPVGFVKDTYEGKDYMGLTCAACHTNQINYNGYGIRVDGAPTLANVRGLFLDLASALKATLEQPEKFERMANALNLTGEAQLAELRKSLESSLKSREDYNFVNAPMHGDELVDYGYGRLDAFGGIFNRILSHMNPDQDPRDNPDVYNPANAPVSYPFLWDTPQHDFVQWNGIADNKGAGPLGRNTGEVLGVFASFELKKTGHDLGYRSSADIRNLRRLESHLESLESPLWPAVMPAVDPELAAAGEQVFTEYQCHTCHESIDRSNPKRLVTAQFSSLELIGTDPQMAMNAISAKGRSGLLEGHKLDATNLKKDAPRFGPSTPVAPALTKAATGTIAQASPDEPWYIAWPERIADIILTLRSNPVKVADRHVDFEIVEKSAKSLTSYKGRPLNGIWATAPYLHNGSVPNLYDLFLPSCTDTEIESGKACRPNTFTLGSREFDPKHVGFVEKSSKEHSDLFVFDTTKPSNSNAGHEYTAGKTPVIKLGADGKPALDENGKRQLEWLPAITEGKRLALVEYLKTL